MAARKTSWSKELKRNKRLMIISLVCMAVLLPIYIIAGKYVAHREPGVTVPDLILDALPVVNLSAIFVFGFLAIMVSYFVYPFVARPRLFHAAIIQMGLLLAIRGAFIVMLFLGKPEGAIKFSFPWPSSEFSFENDFFFSGHVAASFLGFLVFEKPVRYWFLAASIIMAAVVLLGHLHYSIDVFAAFFITYGSYRIGEKLIAWIERSSIAKGRTRG